MIWAAAVLVHPVSEWVPSVVESKGVNSLWVTVTLSPIGSTPDWDHRVESK